MTLENVLKSEEAAVYRLRALYRRYGYLPFKMSKFEEYDLYVQSKDFLISDRIITFNDTDGKLLALKPDVTLSIIKNASDAVGTTEKFCYNENVYRVSGSTHCFKEIMQSGLECIGDIDRFSECEVVALAVRSLKILGRDYLLDLSHTGIVSALLCESGLDEAQKARVLVCLGEKNPHGIREVFGAEGRTDIGEALCGLVGIYGSPREVLPALEALCTGEAARAALEELKAVCASLSAQNLADCVRIDFSVANDMNYYSGLVFRGFVDGIPSGILSGGRYDPLMRKLGKKSGAVGFAVYLDLLELLEKGGREYSADTLLLYSADASASAVLAAEETLSQDGTVFASRSIPAKQKYRKIVKLTDRGLETVEENG